ncbi:MAG: hypothetical protein JWP13_352 [Candidatus Saccharibacteria bacterium]|nr:hypothetical protein [Candidatus Saccharibacteria bacterium]
MNELKAGVYKHYKGGLYMVLGTARHSESREKLVAYIPLGVKAGPRMTVRPYGMFFEDVIVQGRQIPRFTYIGEDVEEPVADWYDSLSGYKGADRVDD